MNSAAEYVQIALSVSHHGRCEFCSGEGNVDVRHPELDAQAMAEVWVTEPCECRAGQEWAHAMEMQEIDIALDGEDYYGRPDA